jgi:transcription initiation factor TFIIIB Brf1 subunit/transcription initiation factor TFIIB
MNSFESSCEECSCELVYQNGYYVCHECGLINNGLYEYTGDYLGNSSGIDTESCLNPYTELSTFTQKGSNFCVTVDNKICKSDIHRLHVQLSYNSKQRSFDKVENIIDNFDLPDPLKTFSKKLWAFVMSTKKIYRGNNRLGLIACCIYYSCFNYSCPKTSLEICKQLGIHSKFFNKSNKLFIEIFDKSEWSYLLYKCTTISDYILRYVSQLEVENFIKPGSYYSLYKECLKILESGIIDTEKFEPKNIACAIVYVTINKNIPAPTDPRDANNKVLKKQALLDLTNTSCSTINKIISLIDS